MSAKPMRRASFAAAVWLALSAVASAKAPQAVFYMMNTPKSVASFEAHIDADESFPMITQYDIHMPWDPVDQEAFFFSDRDGLREWVFMPEAIR